MTGIEELPLRDIHLPDTVSWWPPAPGWWILFGLIALAIVICYAIRVTYKRRQLRRAAIREFNNIRTAFAKHRDDMQLVRDLSSLLRRIAISYYPRDNVAGLTGDEWLGFLDNAFEQNTGKQDFTQGAGRALVTAPYRPQIDVDTEALIKLCNNWVMCLPMKPAGITR